MLATHHATRYLTPLREGGSMPAVLATEDGDLFVTKFRGAGQGAKALVAEIIVGELARHVGLPVPELALIEVNASFGRTERDPEIQDILRGSQGVNVGMRYLDGALNFDIAADTVDPALAARVVWLDALTCNLDRTARNTNLMIHNDALWLIDHGAALYFHHDWSRVDEKTARSPFAPITDHVLLPVAGDLAATDAALAEMVGDDDLSRILDAVPDTLLMDAPTGVAAPFASAYDNRQAYQRYFHERLTAPRAFVDKAIEAQKAVGQQPHKPLGYRR